MATPVPPAYRGQIGEVGRIRKSSVRFMLVGRDHLRYR